MMGLGEQCAALDAQRDALAGYISSVGIPVSTEPTLSELTSTLASASAECYALEADGTLNRTGTTHNTYHLMYAHKGYDSSGSELGCMNEFGQRLFVQAMYPKSDCVYESLCAVSSDFVFEPMYKNTWARGNTDLRCRTLVSDNKLYVFSYESFYLSADLVRVSFPAGYIINYSVEPGTVLIFNAGSVVRVLPNSVCENTPLSLPNGFSPVEFLRHGGCTYAVLYGNIEKIHNLYSIDAAGKFTKVIDDVFSVIPGASTLTQPFARVGKSFGSKYTMWGDSLSKHVQIDAANMTVKKLNYDAVFDDACCLSSAVVNEISEYAPVIGSKTGKKMFIRNLTDETGQVTLFDPGLVLEPVRTCAGDVVVARRSYPAYDEMRLYKLKTIKIINAK